MKNRNLETPVLLPATALVLILGVGSLAAKNVDLVTLPDRQTTQLTIYNSEDLTLARETRSITLKEGRNRLQFSWANTLIDPTSVEIRPLEHAGEIEIADTVFPGQKPQHLIWNIDSKYEGQVRFEVTYFTSGLTWQMDYVATCDPGETEMQFRGYVRVFNNSGEEYDNAEIRLIVGKINLVESIAALARRHGVPVPDTATRAYYALKQRAAARAFGAAESAERDDLATNGERKKIVKEGVSEYFMFSVEGTESISDGWSKRLLAVEADDVAFDIIYRMRSHQYGPRPVRSFIWRNDETGRLGESPLPDGRVRLFRDNGQDGLSYLGEQLLRYVPIDAEIEVNLGSDDRVVFEARKEKTERFNFFFRNGHVRGWDERQVWVHTMRNYRTKPIVFELRLQYGGDVEFIANARTSAFDYRTIEAKFRVGARSQEEFPHTLILHHGENAKQSRVVLKRPG